MINNMNLKHFSWDTSFWGMYWRYYAFERCCSTSRKRLAISGWSLEGNTTLFLLQHRWETSAKSICWLWLQNYSALVIPTAIGPCCQSWEALKTGVWCVLVAVELMKGIHRWLATFSSLCLLPPKNLILSNVLYIGRNSPDLEMLNKYH